MNPWKRYLQWRHSKGFGVHSPYAFRLIMNVVRPGEYGYYAYEDADNILDYWGDASHKTREFVRFLIRLAIFLDIRRFVSPSSCLQDTRKIMDVVARSLKIPCISPDESEDFKFQKGDFLIVDGKVEKDNLCREAIFSKRADRVPVLALDASHKLLECLETADETGLLLVSNHKALRIPREEMAFLSYSILM